MSTNLVRFGVAQSDRARFTQHKHRKPLLVLKDFVISHFFTIEYHSQLNRDRITPHFGLFIKKQDLTWNIYCLQLLPLPAKGPQQLAVIWPSLLAGNVAMAQPGFTSLDGSSEAQVSFSAATRGQPILAGTEVIVSGQNFKPGQQVNLLHGETPLLDQALTADADGAIEGRITVPADAVIGSHPVVEVARNPYHAVVAPLKISPTISLFGQEDHEVVHARATRVALAVSIQRKEQCLVCSFSHWPSPGQSIGAGKI